MSILRLLPVPLLLLACDPSAPSDRDTSPTSDSADDSATDTGAVDLGGSGLMLINELMADYRGGNDPATSGDWLELVNLSGDVVMTDQLLIATDARDDGDITRAHLVCPGVSIAPDEHLVVSCGDHQSSGTCYTASPLILNADAVTLWVSSPGEQDWTVADRVGWSGVVATAQATSYARSPDLGDAWKEGHPTPGSPNP